MIEANALRALFNLDLTVPRGRPVRSATCKLRNLNQYKVNRAGDVEWDPGGAQGRGAGSSTAAMAEGHEHVRVTRRQDPPTGDG